MPLANSLVAPRATRVMVVDDSAVVRGLVSRFLKDTPDIEVVCTAPNGAAALDELQQREIDIVLLDIEMPVMDGMAALERIVADHPGVQVIMASTLTRRNAEISLRAIGLGAADYIPKPEAGLGSAEDFKRELIAKVQGLSARRIRRQPLAASGLAPSAVAPVAPVGETVLRPVAPASHGVRSRPKVLAIGASTGGPPALLQLFEALRGAIEQPMLLTQHMPATFTTLLAEQLSRAGDRPCAEGKDGEPVQPGRCYVAPGGWHMTVEHQGPVPTLRVTQDPPENFCRPAVDPMLRGVANVYGAGALAVILTGMGSDGAKGCEAIGKAGGRFIVQDEESSVVWGMPGAAAATGMAERILPMRDIGPWLRLSMGAAA